MVKAESALAAPCPACERRALRRQKVVSSVSYFVKYVMPWLAPLIWMLCTRRG
jgi:hypothetical protein